jgi:hypothetical protein
MSVYFIEAIGARRVKIGFSDDPAKRLSQLQTGSPHKLQLLFSLPGDCETERQYHKKYAHLRVGPNSEWFYFDAELKQLIDAAMMYDPHRPEEHEDLPVLRGILTNLTERWFENNDGTTESPMAFLLVWCPECRRHHRHGWCLDDDYDVVSHRAAHCDKESAFSEKGYFIGVVKQPGVHSLPPGKPIVRLIRRRRRPAIK